MHLGFSGRAVASLLPLVVGAGLLAGCSGASNGSSEDIGESSSALSANALTANENTAYAFFVNKGLTPVQAAGIVGNLIQESSVLPSSVQAGGPGRGIAQWSTGGRWDSSSHDNVEWYAAEQGLSSTSLTLQLEFVWYELETFSGYGLAKLKAASTVSAATIAFETEYEGCGACEQSQRIAYAEEVLDGHSSTTPGAECYSSTLGREVVNNTCVQSRSNDLWYQCDSGNWVERATDPAACVATYPL